MNRRYRPIAFRLPFILDPNPNPRKEVTSLHRDFHSGRLMAYGWKYPERGMGGEFSQLIEEPISDADREWIGDIPIPPVLAKVDL